MPPTPEPRYEVTTRDGAYEVRRYAPRVIAETHVGGGFRRAGNEGFRRLAGYLFGKNRGRSRMSMTAPVGLRPPSAPATAGDDDGWAVTFTMPTGATLASLPAPDDARVRLHALPATEVAVVRFSGRWTEANLAPRREALARWTAAHGRVAAGEPELNRYDPPWQPWCLRRNELWLPLVAASPP